MLKRGVHCLLVLCVLQFGGGAVSAQIPDEFTNLKLLPKDISKRELIGIMREFASGLGKRCNYCHPGGNPTPICSQWEGCADQRAVVRRQTGNIGR